MFNPKIYIPSNIKGNKQNNALITNSFQNNAIDLLNWFGIDLLNGNSSLVLSQAGTWVSPGGFWQLDQTNITNINFATGGIIASDKSNVTSDTSVEVSNTGMFSLPSSFFITKNKAATEFAYAGTFDFGSNYAFIANYENAAGDKNNIKINGSGLVLDTWVSGSRTTRLELASTGFNFQVDTDIHNVASINFDGSVALFFIPSYADDAAAISGGLSSGYLYKTTTGGITALNIVP